MSRPRFFSLLRSSLLIGDWLVLTLSALAVAGLFHALWHTEPANKLRIRQGERIFATLSLDQTRSLEVQGPLGVSKVTLEHGKVRFAQSPCNNQYCVHQGWLDKAGQVAVCLPNRISIELLGSSKPYDSLNY